MRRSRWLLALSVSLIVAGALLLGEQSFLRAKGWLAEVLISRAFAAHLADGAPHPPWSWADFHPVARLEVPRLGVRRHVLAGLSGTSMAFGIGHMDGTALPGDAGNCVLAGHRDSWMSFLRELRVGDEIELTTAGARRRYVVSETLVIPDTDTRILDPTAEDQLQLVTCYPFRGWRRSPWRFVAVCR